MKRGPGMLPCIEIGGPGFDEVREACSEIPHGDYTICSHDGVRGFLHEAEQQLEVLLTEAGAVKDKQM